MVKQKRATPAVEDHKLEEVYQRFDELLETILEQIQKDFSDALKEEMKKAPLLLAKAKKAGSTYLLVQIQTPHDERLSSREREIAILAGAGLQNKIIAQQLGISTSTVACHMRKIFEKLEVESRTELAHQSFALMS